MLLWIVGFCLLGLGAVAGSASMLMLPDRIRRVLVPSLTSYAAGTLLGAAFLGMIPAALAGAPARSVSSTLLAGMVLFFVLEKGVRWHHCHEDHCEVHGSAGPLILIGDAFHNFVDGVVITAAFMTDLSLGIATALAVIAHEIPQELGDFAILLESGYGRREALLWNGLSSMTTLIGGVVAYIGLESIRESVPFILALSAASFLYIATADLIPGLHRQVSFGASLRQLILLLAGIGTILLFHRGP
ncbi:MAG: ZIP family metal transporter [Deltaproteobacteria bacterium]|nr:ZIP family metal transporter [Deltaproteobacteria bacterium]